MKFKIGIGLLLFGIILSNGNIYNGYWFLAGLIIGGIGLAMIVLSSGKDKEE
ncbi:MAG: hypothetical protein ACI4JS_08910 [Oscillospiraceae bacterium]